MGARVRRGLSWSPHLAVPTAVRSEETSTFPSLLVSEAGRRVWPITRTVSAVPAGHRQAARGCGCGCGCGRSKGGVSSCRSKAAAQGGLRSCLAAPLQWAVRGARRTGAGAWHRHGGAPSAAALPRSPRQPAPLGLPACGRGPPTCRVLACPNRVGPHRPQGPGFPREQPGPGRGRAAPRPRRAPARPRPDTRAALGAARSWPCGRHETPGPSAWRDLVLPLACFAS